ncbi:MAG: PIG-L deacetylase family protein [Gemmatimonadota bacterium]|jgi:LmbE family N-acetylglucosaminyl deacetylase
MLSLALAASGRNGLRVLCLGAHPDDIEIGCGGLVLSLLGARPDVEVRWVVLGAHGDRADEARASAGGFLAGAARADVDVLDFRDGFFPGESVRIKEWFEALKGRIEPDLILTHRQADRHQDHRTVSELTWNTFRHHLVLEYEIPKYDGDLGQPNVFVPVAPETRTRKVALLLEHFASQRGRTWFTADTFEGLMRLRGIECASPTGFAEAFHARKLTLGIGG